MSTRFRNMGFSPDYAQLGSGSSNSFAGNNTFLGSNTLGTSGTLTALTGSTTTFNAGSTLTISGTIDVPAPTTTNNAVNKNYVDLRITKTSTNASHFINIDTNGRLIAAVATIDAGDPLQAATKGWADTKLALKLDLAGGTLTGALTLSGAPTVDLHASTKKYVDDGLALKLNLSGGTLGGTLILANHPSTGGGNALQAATKQYVDNKLGVFEAGAGLYKIAGQTDGQVTSILITSGGSGYGSAPGVTIDAPDAAAWNSGSSYVDGNIIKNASNKVYRAMASISSGGSEPVHTSGTVSNWKYLGSLTTATATSVINGTGNVVYVYVTNMGMGYTVAPSVTFSSGAATATAYIAEAIANVSIASNAGTINVAEDYIDLQTLHSGTFSGGGSYSGSTYYAGLKVDQYGRVTTATTNLGSVLSSTTLNLTTGNINLNVINSGTFPSTETYNANSYYHLVKVDQYGRVVGGISYSNIPETDGWYNSVRVQGGRISQVANNSYVAGNVALPVQIGGDASATLSTTTIAANTVRTNVNLTLNSISGLSAGTYTKVTVNTKGLVTAASALSSSDITNALGYIPPRDSNVQMVYLKGSFQASSWGTSAIPSYTVNSGSITGMSMSGSPNRIYLPAGIYLVNFWGSNNWYSSYYNNYWYQYDWWSNYWTYYYQPSVIYKNGVVTTSAFANYGGWWWYYNSSYKSDVSQDFFLSDVVQIDNTNSYVQLGLPMLAYVTFWYNVKIVKLK